MKAALLIEVSEYKDPANNLPGCKNDLETMQSLLHLTGEYQEILALSGSNVPASELKSKLSTWFEEHRKEPIEELFFYYSGHGEFYDDEFYFQLFDFQRTKRHQTSLTNSGLDMWLRDLSPALTLKVIDACNSGVPYIKGGGNSVKNYFTSSSEGLQRCIFMYSSTVSQSSYQSSELSDFTRTFVEAVARYEGEVIRYRDIMEYISDEFENNGSSDLQAPVFVVQAHNTEVFCQISDQIRQLPLKKQIASDLAIEDASHPIKLKQLVEQASKQLASKDEALQTLTQLQSELEGFQYSEELLELYTIKAKFLSTDQVPLKIHIGQWLGSNKHNYFAQPTYTTVFEDPMDVILATQASFFSSSRQRIRSRGRKELDGFKFTAETPFEGFQIVAQRKYLSLNYYYCAMTYLISKSKIIFYFFYTAYREKNWDETSLNLDVFWRTTECNLADKGTILSVGTGILSGFQSYVLEEVKAQFNSE